jgi:hypothetical protein
MTKSTITRERLIKKAQEQIEFCRHTKITGEGRDHVNQCAALFEIALAAMDSEPVGYFGRFDPDDEDLIDQCSKNVKGAFPLYRHAQPVPVVSADLLHTAASAIEDLLEHTDPNTSYYSAVWADVPGKLRAAMLQARNSPVLPEEATPDNIQIIASIRPPHGVAFQLDKADCKLAADIWNACRGAMLQPDNSPVIPDGSVAMLRRWLAFGRGMQNAGSHLPHNLIAETEEMLAAAPQEVK